MEINMKRLQRRFYEMASIGSTENEGVHRLALSDQDKIARDTFIDWSKQAGFLVRIDDFGNIYVRKEGTASKKPIVIGSHLDTVPKGGKYDGSLGVLAGFEILESLLEIEPLETPVEVVVFTNEEGARFPNPMLGSGAISGVFSKQHVYDMVDDDGITFESELERIGYKGDKANRLKEFEAFFELHIEQGPVLEQQGLPIGLVKGIQGLSWHTVQFTGESDHAGTTPISYRRDPMQSAAKAIMRIGEWVENLGDETLVTFGKISSLPNTINVIPSEVTFSMDIRHPNKKVLLRRIETAKTLIREVALEDDTQSLCEDLSLMLPVLFDESLIDLLQSSCQQHGIGYHEMFSGAGHDAMYMNNLGPTVMLFSPSVNGKSHCEEEETSWEDIEKSVKVLGESVVRLASSVR
ncbi:Zn-dependent hydrolase [Virgibacillus sp. C22-A2]|uniref:Zn-dependent hydrolase n=1 Tax=Virgibacillus tibetensis TaxID=3042313 RepID=A0ABU6KD76_9BACI|nr:Zn-dependent hydrolase [Virgibacillus sp. C22-A2]